MKLVLGSKSPRRQALLNQLNLQFDVFDPNVDEKQITTTDPATKVIETAKLKATALPIHEQTINITADTIVSYQNKIFEKPKDRNDARNMLETLSGNTHEVYSAVILKSSDFEEIIISKTEVNFYTLTSDEIERYLDSGEYLDKAGAYGIQALGVQFVESIQGDYNTIVGLPLGEVYRFLSKYI